MQLHHIRLCGGYNMLIIRLCGGYNMLIMRLCGGSWPDAAPPHQAVWGVQHAYNKAVWGVQHADHSIPSKHHTNHDN